MVYILTYIVPPIFSFVISFFWFRSINRAFQSEAKKKPALLFVKILFAVLGIGVINILLHFTMLALADGGLHHIQNWDSSESMFILLALFYNAFILLFGFLYWVYLIFNLNEIAFKFLKRITFSEEIYLKCLACFYAIGGVLHLADVFGLRMDFSEMNMRWKVWSIYLLVADTIAAIGLWKNKSWGVFIFLFIAFSQLIAYTQFRDLFGTDQNALIWFHIVTITGYFVIKFYKNRRLSP